MALRSYPVAFAPKARLDLLDIGDHIAQDSPAEARRFVARLTVQCQRIGRSPFGYASRDDLIAGLRMATMGRYVIFFRVLDHEVRIERVLHGARNLPAVFSDDDTA